jgi:hypothetical protein
MLVPIPKQYSFLSSYNGVEVASFLPFFRCLCHPVVRVYEERRCVRQIRKKRGEDWEKLSLRGWNFIFSVFTSCILTRSLGQTEVALTLEFMLEANCLTIVHRLKFLSFLHTYDLSRFIEITKQLCLLHHKTSWTFPVLYYPFHMKTCEYY